MPVILTDRRRGINGDTDGVLGMCGSCDNNSRLHGFAGNIRYDNKTICYIILVGEEYGHSYEGWYNERDGCHMFWPYDERDIPIWKRALEEEKRG